MAKWILTNSLAAGVFALLWLLLRSGSKPSRFAYPCQQAALSAASLAFGVPLVSTLIAARRQAVRFGRRLTSPKHAALAILGLILTAGMWGYLDRADAYATLPISPPADYRAKVFHTIDCPENPIGDRFLGLDQLITQMGREGVKFYQSQDHSLVAGPDGIIAADDIVVIKINYQWPERGGTNTDLLRGLIRRLVDHPDGFVGEIVVCENAQFNPVDGFNRSANNAQDITLSPHDVVVGFQSQGYAVSHYDWTVRRNTSVGEYDQGNMTDGYVLYPYDANLQGRISYPKFRTDYGTYISLKNGIWDPIGGSYDWPRLKFINLPVLKSHHAVYGMTACVKNHMGTVSGALGTNSHNAIRYGILGAMLGEIGSADLNILDAVWINANPYDGPWTEYGGATRKNQLIASLDPVAADIYAATNVLIPTFLENGYSPPWPVPSADPANPASAFRMYLDNSMSRLIETGIDATNDLGQIDAFVWSGAGDFDLDGDIDATDFERFAACYTGPGVVPPDDCEPADFDADLDVDCFDFDHFNFMWTGPGDPPTLAACEAGAMIPAVSHWGMVVMSLLTLCVGTIGMRPVANGVTVRR